MQKLLNEAPGSPPPFAHLGSAAKKRVCYVARLADIPDIGFASRLASVVFWPCNAYVKVNPTGS